MYIRFLFVLVQFLGSATSRPNVVGQGYRPAAFQGPTTPRNVDTFFTLTAGINSRNGDLSGIAPANPLQKVRRFHAQFFFISDANRDTIGTLI